MMSNNSYWLRLASHKTGKAATGQVLRTTRTSQAHTRGDCYYLNRTSPAGKAIVIRARLNEPTLTLLGLCRQCARLINHRGGGPRLNSGRGWVTFHKASRSWRAVINHDGKKLTLRSSAERTVCEAALATYLRKRDGRA